MISKAIHRFLEDIDDRNSNKHKILTLITGYSRKHMCVGKVIYGDVVQLIGIYYGSWYNIFEIMLKKHPEILRENCHFETIDISAKRKRRKFSLSLKQIVMNSTNKTTFNCHVLVNVNSNITQELNNALNLFNNKETDKQFYIYHEEHSRTFAKGCHCGNRCWCGEGTTITYHPRNTWGFCDLYRCKTMLIVEDMKKFQCGFNKRFSCWYLKIKEFSDSQFYTNINAVITIAKFT
eukprot:268970_1